MGWCRYRYPKSPRLTFYKASFWVSICKFPGCTNATLHRYTPPQPRSNIFVNMGSSSPLCWGEHWKIYVQPPPSRPHSKTHQQPFESMYLPIENGVFFSIVIFFWLEDIHTKPPPPSPPPQPRPSPSDDWLPHHDLQPNFQAPPNRWRVDPVKLRQSGEVDQLAWFNP